MPRYSVGFGPVRVYGGHSRPRRQRRRRPLTRVDVVMYGVIALCIAAVWLLAACGSSAAPRGTYSPADGGASAAASASRASEIAKAQAAEDASQAAAAAAAPAYVTPTTADFTITLKILSKQCFGDAGCVLTYRPTLAENLTAGSLDPSVTYDLTYVVHGSTDGQQLDTMTITGDQYDQPSEQEASTASPGAKLTVTISEVTAE